VRDDVESGLVSSGNALAVYGFDGWCVRRRLTGKGSASLLEDDAIGIASAVIVRRELLHLGLIQHRDEKPRRQGNLASQISSRGRGKS
jgi:hypothetical protein